MTQATLPLGDGPQEKPNTSMDPEQGEDSALQKREYRSRGRKNRPAGTRGSPAWSAVAEALEDDPDADAEDLYRIAAREDPRIRELTLRQFNARIPLQIKRLMAAEGMEGQTETDLGDRGAG